ncbi:RNA polymerase sigma factor [Mumia sp. DW29H23]|uniref:RNA polymerase sigma factor n=1 Tax=Mumia sp. DW29H23 TaxID=3421241 RepID=UPI003D69F070
MPSASAAASEDPVRDAFRAHWGEVVASLVRLTSDLSLAEDCAQEAYARASVRWPLDGVPERPRAWLVTVARNDARNRIKRAANERTKLALLSTTEHGDDGGTEQSVIDDDLLRLVLACCHPSLPTESQVALTLRTVVGLSTDEVARAFTISPSTAAQRLVRGKNRLRELGPSVFADPSDDQLAARVDAVLAVVYLLFNEGYAATRGPVLVRGDLCDEALYLGRTVARLVPEEPDAVGLVALMELTHARRTARVDAAGELLTLEEQDRSLWDRGLVARAVERLDAVPPGEAYGPYRIQAEIAACHAAAPSADATDWPRILRWYDALTRAQPTPVVALNRAVAVAMATDLETGLAEVDALDRTGSLRHHHLVPATRADLLVRLGRPAEALGAYDAALALVDNDVERRFLERRRRGAASSAS